MIDKWAANKLYAYSYRYEVHGYEKTAQNSMSQSFFAYKKTEEAKYPSEKYAVGKTYEEAHYTAADKVQGFHIGNWKARFGILAKAVSPIKIIRKRRAIQPT